MEKLKCDNAGPDNPNGVGIFRLVTSVVTLIVGAGVFAFTGDMAAKGAHTGAVLVAWGLSFIGVFCLMMSFFGLSRLRPDLKSGIYSYAKEGFGEFAGFNSAWGYWISALMCTVSFSALLFAGFAYFFPIFGEGNNIPSIIGASVILWVYIGMVSRGFKEAAAINAVVTVSKFLPIITAVVAILLFQKFNPDIFFQNFWGSEGGTPLYEQIMGAVMVTSWVFVGIEAAIALSGRARRARDVGRATKIAFFCVAILYLSVSVVGMGVLPQEELAQLPNPSLAGIMEAAVGHWGGMLISFGVCLSLLGAMFGYTMLWSECPYEAAVQGVFTKSFARVNKKGAPWVTLLVSGLVIQFFLILMHFSHSAYQFFYIISLGMILIPYMLSSAYFVKLSFTDKESFSTCLRGKLFTWRIYGFVGVLYSLFLMYATGWNFLMLMAILYLPGIPVYIKGKIERGEPWLDTTRDKLICAGIVICAVVSIILLATGTFSIF